MNMDANGEMRFCAGLIAGRLSVEIVHGLILSLADDSLLVMTKLWFLRLRSMIYCL